MYCKSINKLSKQVYSICMIVMHVPLSLRMYTPHYIYRLWLRLSNMTNDRLNKQVFNEASNLAANNGHQNWIVHTIDILKIHNSIHTPAPTLSNDQRLQYNLKYLIKAAVARWQVEIAEDSAGSDSRRRLVWYRQIQNAPSTEIYLTTMNSLGGRRAMRDSGQAAYHWQWRCAVHWSALQTKGMQVV